MLSIHLIAALSSAAIAVPLLNVRRNELVIPGSFICQVDPDSNLESIIDNMSRAPSTRQSVLGHQYDMPGFKGFSIHDVDDIDAISSLANIHGCHPNTKVSATAITSQSGAPYGLARLSQSAPITTDTGTYLYDDTAGSGSYAYVVDTGCKVSHVEFEGRATFLQNFAGDGIDDDGNGHGTHVSGTIGSKSYGVAKKVQIMCIKVLDSSGSGTSDNVIAGINYAVQHAKDNGIINKSVLNLSLGGPGINLPAPLQDATSAAAKAAVSAGMFLAVAAGNSMLPAGLSAPANEPSVCTVGALDNTDKRAYFSNFGILDEVDIYAVGVDVLSTFIDPNDASVNTATVSHRTAHL